MNPDVTTVSWWVAQLGPSGIVIFIVWRVLIFLRPIVLELVPYLKKLLIGHINLMDAMESQLNKGSEKLNKISETQDDHTAMLASIHQKVAK